MTLIKADRIAVPDLEVVNRCKLPIVLTIDPVKPAIEAPDLGALNVITNVVQSEIASHLTRRLAIIDRAETKVEEIDTKVGTEMAVDEMVEKETKLGRDSQE